MKVKIVEYVAVRLKASRVSGVQLVPIWEYKRWPAKKRQQFFIVPVPGASKEARI